MIGLCITIAVLIGIGLIRIGADITYRDGETAVKVRFAGFPFTVFPQQKQKKKKEKKVKKRSDENKKTDPEAVKEKRKSKLTLPVIRLYLSLAKDILLLLKRRLPPLWRSFWIPKLYLYLCAATPDAAETAILYGKICAFVSAVYPVYRDALHITKHDVTIDLDFCRDSLYIDAEIQLRTRIGSIVIFALSMAFGALWYYMKTEWKKKKLEQEIQDKAVQVNE